MLDSQNRLQNCFKNTKTTKFPSELAFYTSEGHTCKVLSFYDFWFTFNDKFCSPYPIVDFYAYLITKIGNRNLKSGLRFVLIRSQAIISDKKFDILSWKNEMCIFSLLWQSKCCNIENFFSVKVCQTFHARQYLHVPGL